MKKEATIAASEFKARCLRFLDEVAEQGRSLVITKHGRPIAKLVPLPTQPKPLGGRWEGQVKIRGDVVNFETTSEWEALQ